MVLFIVLLIASYFLGAIPTGYLLCKFFYKIDITKVGSFNMGATNVARVTGKRLLFVPVFLIDAGKSFIFLFFSEAVLSKYYCCKCFFSFCIISIAVVILFGNSYSIFINFRGGKGVATSMGIIGYALSVKFLLIFGCLWLLFVWIFKQAFIASLGVISLLLATTLYLGYFSQTQLFLITYIFIWLIFRHKNNLEKWAHGSN